MIRKNPNNINKQGRPLLRCLLIPMTVLVILEILLLVGSIFFGGLTSSLDQNAKDILYQKVASRATYLQDEMVDKWSDISLTAETINQKALKLDKEGEIELQELGDRSEKSLPLLEAISGDLISLIRSNRVTGAFVILNTDDLSKAVPAKKPGLYIRDLDPTSTASESNSDLLLKRAPISLINKLGISTDNDWSPQFNFTHTGYEEAAYLYKPYENARKSSNQISVTDLGYWSRPFTLNEKKTHESGVISYSIPLRLSDGMVYGVLGIDITLDYLQTLLPYDELVKDKQGAYLLAIQKGESFNFTNILANGPVYAQATQSDRDTNPQITKDNAASYYLRTDQYSGDFYCTVCPLNLYNTNTAFDDDQWVLIGSVKTNNLFAASHGVISILTLAIILTLILGICGSLLISYLISKPITTLTKEMRSADPKKTVVLQETNISEVDQLSASIQQLSHDMIDANDKFTKILEMASIKIAGFDINLSTKALFLSDRFFELFKMPEVDTRTLTCDEFLALMRSFDKYSCEVQASPDDTFYEVPHKNGIAYIHLKYMCTDGHHIGLVEDVTQSVLERKLIEHERDHDLLTGLINRRAFYREMNRLFSKDRSLLKVAAMVMIDLDDLKYTNDTYGHDCGDKYITSAVNCFVSATPSRTIISRMSGDEFCLLFYGYDTETQIEEVFGKMKENINQSVFILPDGQKGSIRLTGGISWYPKDSTTYHELIQYADFAMYKTKRTFKGHFSDFNVRDYNKEAYHLQSRSELTEILTHELVEYHFQPIICAGSGKIVAYEALMRADMPTLRTPNEILEIARDEGKLEQVERMTARKSIEAFAGHVRSGAIEKDCLLFFNSLPNQALPFADLKKVEELYEQHLPQLVLEITEEERLSEKLQNAKMDFIQKWNCGLALDDYGSGYNSEKALLELSPDYVKVDMNIIRDIHQNTNKQEIVRHIVSYGHERDMKIIAEGIENQEEAAAVIELDVDYLQGYYIAKPGLIPPHPSPAILELIGIMKESLS